MAEVPNLDVLNAEKVSLEQNATQLEATIQQLQLKVAALSDTATEKRQEAQSAFRTKHAKRFADIDTNRALAGFPSMHAMIIAGTKYSLRVPSGEHQREVMDFVQEPISKVGDKVTNIGPVTQAERIVLCWLVAVTMGDKTQDLTAEPIAVRLKRLRSLPVVVISNLANECEALETYLSVTLELELGNSSPTP